MSIHLDHQTLGTGVLHAQPVALPVPVQRKLSKTRTALRAVVAVLTTSTVVVIMLIGVVLAAERLAPLAWRPSTLLGAFGGRQEAAQILTAIEAKRAEVGMQQEEAARAQQEVIVIQANNDRVTRAYEALYQRGNMLAQQWAEGAKQTLILDTQAKMQALQGRAGVASTKDHFAMWCDLGNLFSPDIRCGDALRNSARADREAISEEIIGNFKAKSLLIATSLQDWAQGLPDPAQVVAYKNSIEQLHPVPRLPVPPAPIPAGSSL